MSFGGKILSFKLIIIFTFLLFHSLSYAGEKIVRVATLEDYAPFCFTTGNVTISTQLIEPGHDAKGFKGFCWDVLRESYHEMGYTIYLTITPWARAIMNLKRENVDILFPTGKNSERLKIFNYSEEPTNEANFVIYVTQKSTIEWQGLDELKGLAIAVKRDFNYGDKWKAVTGIEKYNIGTIQQGFEMLDGNRIDGFLGYEYNWDYFLKQKNLIRKYKKLPAFDSSAEYLTSLKTNSNGKALLTVFDEGKRRLITSKKLALIKAKWFGEQ